MQHVTNAKKQNKKKHSQVIRVFLFSAQPLSSVNGVSIQEVKATQIKLADVLVS